MEGLDRRARRCRRRRSRARCTSRSRACATSRSSRRRRGTGSRSRRRSCRREPEVIREAIEAEIAPRRAGLLRAQPRSSRSAASSRRSRSSLPVGPRRPSRTAQMPEAELEKAMLRFFSREADVLLATAIVENGLDIPSANTILIDRADTFGLAQLYQLRGRVGRSDKPAYAYLLVEETAALSDVARRRLASIQEFCDLGAGLPHRGQGPRDPRLGQHPRAASSRATSRRSASRRTCRCSRRRSARCAARSRCPERAVTLSLGLDLAIPHDYVEDENWRMMIYKKVARAGDDAALEETRARDRGPVRRAAAGRAAAGRVRAAARAGPSGSASRPSRGRRAGSTCASPRTPPVDAERLLEFVRSDARREPLAGPRPDASGPARGRAARRPASSCCRALGPSRRPEAWSGNSRPRAVLCNGHHANDQSPRRLVSVLGLAGGPSPRRELVEQIVARVNDRLDHAVASSTAPARAARRRAGAPDRLGRAANGRSSRT